MKTLRRSRRRHQSSGLSVCWAVVITAAVTAALNWYAPGRPTGAERLGASLILVLSAMPFIVWNAGWDGVVPFMPLWSFLFATNYALTIFVLSRYWFLGASIEPEADGAIELSLFLAAGALALTLLGYYGWRMLLAKKLKPQVKTSWTTGDSLARKWMFLSIVGTVALGLAFTKLPAVLIEPISLVASLTQLGVAILLLMSRDLKWRYRLGLVIIVMLGGLVGLSAGYLAPLLEFGLTIVMATSITTGLLRLRWLALGFLVFILLQPVKIAFRAANWYGSGIALSPLKAVGEFFETGRQVMGQQPISLETASQILELGVARFNQVLILARVIALTPSVVPYWEGETLKPLVYKVVPRVFYQDKPTEAFGQPFGHRYDFLAVEDDVTSWNMPELPELYANFGVSGLLICAPFLGVLYGVLSDCFFRDRRDIGALACGIFLLSPLLITEINLSQVLSEIAYRAVILWLINFWCRSSPRERGPVGL